MKLPFKISKPVNHYLVSVIFVMAQLSISSCIPIAIPLPWFPKDPYKNSLRALENKNSVHRDDIIYGFGMPWAAINDSNFIYISEKPSSFIVVGMVAYGGGGWGDAGPMTYRDYTVSFYFDDEGNMKSYQTYADTGKHDFCFNNGVCFSRQTRNVPLSPGWMDREAKLFKASPDECTFYLYRQPYPDGRSYKEYVDIQLAQIPIYGVAHPYSVGSSVPGGFFRWQLEPGHTYEVSTDFKIIKSYPFTTHFIHEKRRSPSIDILCVPGGVIYIELVVPKSKKLPVELFASKRQPAQDSIKQLKLLAGKYLPEQ